MNQSSESDLSLELIVSLYRCRKKSGLSSTTYKTNDIDLTHAYTCCLLGNHKLDHMSDS